MTCNALDVHDAGKICIFTNCFRQDKIRGDMEDIIVFFDVNFIYHN